MIKGDLARIREYKYDENSGSLPRYYYKCPFMSGDVVVVLKEIDWDITNSWHVLPTRYKVRNTENDKVFIITADKLEHITEVVTEEDTYFAW